MIVVGTHKNEPESESENRRAVGLVSCFVNGKQLHQWVAVLHLHACSCGHPLMIDTHFNGHQAPRELSVTAIVVNIVGNAVVVDGDSDRLTERLVFDRLGHSGLQTSGVIGTDRRASELVI